MEIEILTGAKFDSFAEFEQNFENWKIRNHHPFRVASSETLRMPDGSVNETFKYRYIVYHCAHYGAPRMRGLGKRPNQNYMPCGCRAMLRVNFSWSENALRITTLTSEHSGHEITADAYAKFASKVRRPSPGLTPERRTTNNRRRQTLKLPTTTGNCHKNKVNESMTNGERLSLTSHQKENELLAHANARILPYLSRLFSSTQQQQQQQQQQQLIVTAPQLYHNRSSPPLDLSSTGTHFLDKRTDSERLQEVHCILQRYADHLLQCRGAEFDGKLKQLQYLFTVWAIKDEKP